jgi:hypothetical protein
MKKERMEAALLSDTKAHKYKEGATSESKEEKQTKDAAAVMSPAEDLQHESTLAAEDETPEDEAPNDIEILDASDVTELVEFMEADDSVDEIIYSSEEDEDSESVRTLYINPKHIIPKAKKPMPISTRASLDEETEEGTGPTIRWLITGCRSCGDMVRFRSDQPKPPTCGRSQCVEKFEERSKASMFNKAS